MKLLSLQDGPVNITRLPSGNCLWILLRDMQVAGPGVILYAMHLIFGKS